MCKAAWGNFWCNFGHICSFRNKTASTFGGLIKLPTKTKSSIQLQLSPSVKHVTFSGNAAAAKKKMKLVADCSNRNLGDISKN